MRRLTVIAVYGMKLEYMLSRVSLRNLTCLLGHAISLRCFCYWDEYKLS